jgi:antitoxin CptB
MHASRPGIEASALARASPLLGGFFDVHFRSWDKDECACFADLLDEQDVDIMAWAHGTAEAPKRFAGPMIEALRRLDYIRIAR